MFACRHRDGAARDARRQSERTDVSVTLSLGTPIVGSKWRTTQSRPLSNVLEQHSVRELVRARKLRSAAHAPCGHGTFETLATAAGASPSSTPASQTANSQTPPSADTPPHSSSRSKHAQRPKQHDVAHTQSRSRRCCSTATRSRADEPHAASPNAASARTRPRTRPLPTAALRQQRGDRASDGDDRRPPRLQRRRDHQTSTGSLTEPSLKRTLPRCGRRQARARSPSRRRA